MTKKIITNKAQCAHCKNIVESKYRHDFVPCSCGKIFVDGGKAYLRRGFDEPGDIIELSEYEEIDENKN